MAEIHLADEFAEFRADLRRHLDDTGESHEDVLFEFYAGLAAENGDCPDLARCRVLAEGRGGYRVDGWAFDQERGTWYLAILDPRPGDELATLNAAQLESLTTRATRFVERILEPDFSGTNAEGSPEEAAGGTVAASPALVKRVQLLVFSEARLSTRKPPELSGEVQGRPVVCNVLDFARYAAIARSRGTAEPIEIDLAALAGHAVPCLPASSGAGGYSSYLIAFPGEVLARIYALYGPRLLEQNVRTFLQARTKVNRGIITTLRETPEMFFAYNNGLTATATSVETARAPDGTLAVSRIEDLQIVNGGQTTASVLYAHDLGADLDGVFVQMKLSVVEPRLVEDMVPLISRYANTQNRISEADFFSGHPFHVTMEQISRRLAPPPRPGDLAGRKWFYERARGQYRDARARRSPSDRSRFDAEYPKAQLIEKTDLAKYEMTFAARPHIVCLGAQKCFLAFAEHISKEWDASPLSFNDGWFRSMAARALVFRWTDRMIARSEWYRADRGHKSQTVAYTLAWLQHHLKKRGKAGLNLQLVWKDQEVPEEIQAQLAALAPQVAAKLRETPERVRDVGEFAKQQACWAMIGRSEFEIPELPEGLVLDVEEQKADARDEADVRRIDLDIELDQLMVALAGRVDEIAGFARRHALLSPKSDAALRRIGKSQFALPPSERNALRQLFNRIIEAGFAMPDTTSQAGESPSGERTIRLSGSATRQVRL